MVSDRWRRARDLFEAAIDKPATERETYLWQACGDDSALANAVRSLLEADADAEMFLDGPLSDPPRPATTSASPSPTAVSTTSAGGAPRIGPYRLLRRIGQGGMGTVHLAVRDDDEFQRRVVIKLVRPGAESPGLRRRLRTERQILASLDHPNIASLFDGGTTDDEQPYFVMEYVDGVPIDAYCDQNRLTIDQRITLFAKVCGAVHYAHQNLVVHRDLKPSNILVTADGEPKLLDFGIAKLLNPDLAAPELEPTATWLRVLTPQYASPEQIRGKLVTTISDVYSLGVLLYRLLTGRLPHRFAGRTAQEIEQLLTEHEPVRPSTAVTAERADDAPDDEPTAEAISRARAEQSADLRRKLAGDLDAIVLKALRSAPRQRYGSVEQLANDLARFRGGLPVTARRGTWRYRTGKLLRRNRLLVVIAAGILAAIVGFGLAMAQQSTRVVRQRDQANTAREQAEAVLSMMLDVFRVADPYSDAGERLTVREALLDSAPILDRRLRDQPLVRAQVLAATGEIFLNLGLWDEAQAQIGVALNIRRAMLGSGSRETAKAMKTMAQVLTEKGQFDEAEALSKGALAIVEPALGRHHADTVSYLNTLVSVYCYRRDMERAEPLATEVLEIARACPDIEPNDLVNALAHLAATRYALGKPGDAAKLYEEAIAVQRVVVGDRHPELAPMLVNRAAALRQLGRIDEAEAAFLDVLSIRRQHFGESHPSIAITLNHVAKLQGAAGRWAEAEASFREAYQLLRTAAAEDHPRATFLELRIIESIVAQRRSNEAAAALRALIDRWPDRAHQLPALRPYAEWLLGLTAAVQGGHFEVEPNLASSFDLILEHDRNLAADVLVVAVSLFEDEGLPTTIESLRAKLAASARAGPSR